MPFRLKVLVTHLIAIVVYFPLARLSYFLERCGLNVQNIPISSYRKASFYTMKTDAYDRFCTRLEQRFSKKQIKIMMINAGLKDIKFSNREPYWCAVGIKK